MYPSRTSNAYGQPSYPSQSAYGQNISMGSRHPSTMGGPQEPDMSGYRAHVPTSAQYAGQYSLRAAASLGSGQQSELYDPLDQVALLRQEQMMRSQSLQPTLQEGTRFTMPTNTNNSTFNLGSILEKDKLTGPNFLDWYRNLRIVLKFEQKDYVLEKAKSNQPTINSSEAEKAEWKRHEDDDVHVACLMLATMSPDLRRQFEDRTAFEIITQLKNMFQEHATAIERYETNCKIINSKLEEGNPVGPHVLKMIGLFDNLRRLGFPCCEENASDIILNSLHGGFGPFIQSYNMQGQDKSLMELYGMLVIAERDIKVAPKAASNVHTVKNGNGFKKSVNVLMVKKGNGFKKSAKDKKGVVNKKGNGKVVADAQLKPKTGPNPNKKNPGNKKNKGNVVAQTQPKPKAGPTPDHECFYCEEKGHWKRNCPKYLEDLKNGIVVSKSEIEQE